MTSLIAPLGWTLLHFLWQGALIAVLLKAVLMLIPQRAAQFRAGACGAALLLMVSAAGATFAVYWNNGSESEPPESALTLFSEANPMPFVMKSAPRTSGPGTAGPAGAATTVPAAPSLSSPAPEPAAASAAPRVHEPLLHSAARMLRPHLNWIVSLWAAGVVLFSLRLAGGWRAISRLRAGGIASDDFGLQARFQMLCEKARVSRPVRLLMSAAARAPMVIGWLKPVVLIPAGMLSSLTSAQVDALLAHELAHIRRHDWLINLLQCAAETLFFYHPAVWWLSSALRTEREHCCDDIASAECGALAYARALTVLEEQRGSLLCLAASGGPLLSRIRRLIEPGSGRARPGAPLLVIALIAVSAAVPVLLAQAEKTPPPDKTRQSRAEPATAAFGETRTTRFSGEAHSGIGCIAGDRTLCAIHYPGRLEILTRDTAGEDGSWSFRTELAAKGKREWSIELRSKAPDTLIIDGKEYDLRAGRVITLSEDEEPLQMNRELPLMTESDLQVIAGIAEDESYLAREYRYFREVEAMPGWMLSLETQHPISHSDGAHMTSLRIFPDGRVVVPHQWVGIQDGRLTPEEMKSLVADLLQTGGFSEEPAGQAVKVPAGGKEVVIPQRGNYALWDQDVLTAMLVLDGKTLRCQYMSPSRTNGVPQDGVSQETWESVFARLQPVINQVQAGGAEGIAAAAAFANQALQERHPGAPKVREETMWAGFASVGDRIVAFRFGEDDEHAFPRGDIQVRFPKEGRTFIDEAKYWTSETEGDQWGRTIERREKKRLKDEAAAKQKLPQ